MIYTLFFSFLSVLIPKGLSVNISLQSNDCIAFSTIWRRCGRSVIVVTVNTTEWDGYQKKNIIRIKKNYY